MSKQPIDDVEAQTSPGSSRDSGRLKKGLRRYEKDLKNLDVRKYMPALSEELFWYQEFGSPISAGSFQFSESASFEDCRMNLRQMLDAASKSSSASLQLW